MLKPGVSDCGRGKGKGEEEVKYAGEDRRVCANSGDGMRDGR